MFRAGHQTPVSAHHSFKTSGTFCREMWWKWDHWGFFQVWHHSHELEPPLPFLFPSLCLHYGTLSICIRECNYSNVKGRFVMIMCDPRLCALRWFVHIIQALTHWATRGWIVYCLRNGLCIWKRLGRFNLYIILAYSSKIPRAYLFCHEKTTWIVSFFPTNFVPLYRLR